jgi:hypothetical protein
MVGEAYNQTLKSLTGFDTSGPVGMLASFTADGTGNITGSIEDINSSGPGSVQANVPITPTGSSYSIGADHRACLTLVTSLGTKVFRIAVGTFSGGCDQRPLYRIRHHRYKRGRDDSNTAAISLFESAGDRQLRLHRVHGLNSSGRRRVLRGCGSTEPERNYRDGRRGRHEHQWKHGSWEYRISGHADVVNGGTYNIGSNGRGTLSFMVSISGAPITINLVVYVLNAGQMNLMSSGAQSATR